MSKREYCHTISQQYNCPRCLLIDLEQANERIKELEAKLEIAVEALEDIEDYWEVNHSQEIAEQALKEFKVKVGK